jgi:hypothetical protein
MCASKWRLVSGVDFVLFCLTLVDGANKVADVKNQGEDVIMKQVWSSFSEVELT